MVSPSKSKSKSAL
jgi:hypothetical protein